MPEYCNGCFSFINSDDDHCCIHLKYNEDGQCPCTTCIIKIMCLIPCSDFINFKLLNIKDQFTTVSYRRYGNG